jgi:dihydrodipicolinate synthase/N-acetylneuraminate lyase
MVNKIAKRYPPCILATCCLPWQKDYTFDEKIFRREVRTLLSGLTQDVYIFGTAGEGYGVTEAQYDQVLRVFREETAKPDVRAMVGVISLALFTIIERIERARELGFRYFQISLPGWGALNDVELKRFFQEVCQRFPDCEFLHYNLSRTKRVVTPEEYAGLAREHPNLVATKQVTDSIDSIRSLTTKAPQLQHFFTEIGYGNTAQIGECGFLISVASMNFRSAREYFAAGQDGDRPRLLEMQRELQSLKDDLLSLDGNGVHMDGAYDKMFCKVHDPKFPLCLLPPYSAFNDEAFRTFVQLVRQKYPRWIA